MSNANSVQGSPPASRANWLLAIPAAFVGALSALMLWPMADDTAQAAALNLHCLGPDRAAVARLATLIESPAMRDARRLDRAVHGLITARTHCAYGWLDQALADYAAIEPSAARARVE
jgi:hypothetical protein